MLNIDEQYRDLVFDVLDGERHGDRTGVGTFSRFGTRLECSLRGGHVPLLTTKKVAWKTAVHELLWFLSGSTNIRPLVMQGVHIWTDWPLAGFRRSHPDTSISREQFESLVKDDPTFAAKYGDLGPVYGKQWRRWTAANGRTVDQVAQVIDLLRDDPHSRRILFHAWNVAEIEDMALPPCHLLYQFHVSENRYLDCQLYQRSADVMLGLPFNLFEAAALVYMLADQAGIEPGKLVWVGGDTHIYANHVAAANDQIARQARVAPTLHLRHRDSINAYVADDFVVADYDPHPAIHFPVAV